MKDANIDTQYQSSILQDAYNEGFKDGSKSLRDHFAGLAMQARVNAIYINKKQLRYILDLCEDEDMSIGEVIAIDSYAIADEMLEARNAK